MNVAVKRRFLCFAIVVLIVWIVLWKIKSQAKIPLNQPQTDFKNSKTPAVVTIFYEALCPDSKNFVLKQLTPTYEKLPELVYIQLVPYGKATTITHPDGTLTFDCQHGERECDANRYHACTIDVVKDNITMLSIIDCMISDNLNPVVAMVKANFNNSKKHVDVTVFYEALCPDCEHFVHNQLTPTYKKLPELINIQLVPYGKATTIKNPDNTYSFKCQHGKLECQANRYHACTIDVVKDNGTMLSIIDCMIRKNLKPSKAMKKCVKKHADDETLQSINQCFSSQRSKELLKMYGEKTNALRPRMTFVPTVTIDGSQGTQALILKNLYLEVCKALAGGGPMPKECEDRM